MSIPNLSRIVLAFLLIQTTLFAQQDVVSYNAQFSNSAFEQLILDSLPANGFNSLTNINVSGSFGNTASLGTFTNGQTAFGINSGIVLCNAPLNEMAFGNTVTGAGSNLNLPGNFNLNLIESVYSTNASGVATFDAGIIRFNFVPTQESLSFNYVFASEEYCDFVGSSFNDKIGIFLSGPGINGPFQINGTPAINIAEFEDLSGNIQNVSINNINNEINPHLYVDNNTANTIGGSGSCATIDPSQNSFNLLTQFDGWTVPLEASYDGLVPGETYTIQIAVADGADRIFGSAIFIEAGSFDAGQPISVIADAGPDQSLTCTIGQVLLGGDSTSLGPDITYEWTDPNGNVFDTNPEVNVFEAGEYILTVTSTISSAMDMDTVLVIEDTEFPGFQIVGSTLLTCANPTTTLEAVLDIDTIPASFQWFGPSGSMISNQQSILINTSGVYTLTVTNINNGCSSQESVAVVEDFETTTNEIDFGVFSTFPVEIDPSNNITNPNAVYSWVPQNGLAVNNFPVATISQPGQYTFLEELGGGACVNSFIYEVLASTLTADAGPDMTIDCNNPVATLGSSFNPMGAEFIYQWVDQLGMPIGFSPFAEVTQPGIYTLTILNNITTESASDVVEVFLNQDIPDALLSSSPDILTCEVQTAVINGVSNSPNVSYFWTTNDGSIISNPALASITVDQGGTYILLVTDNSNGCTSSASSTVLADQDIPVIQIATPPLIMVGQTITLDAQGTSEGSEFTYQWFTNDGNILSNSFTLNPIVNSPGTYCLIATNVENGCTSESCVLVEAVMSGPVIANAGSDQTLTCVVSEVTLDGSNSTQGPSISYEWTDPFGNNIGNTPIVQVSETGQYTLVVTDNSTGVVATDIVIVDGDFEIADFEIVGNNILTCENSTTTLEAVLEMSNIPATFDWEGPGGFTSTQQSVLINTAGTYTLTVTNTSNGCSSEQAIEVSEDTESTIIQIDFGVFSTFPIEIDPSNNITNSNATYSWVPQNGLLVANFPIAIISQPGQYTFQEDLGGGTCVNQFIYTVSASTLTADAGPDMTITCDSPTVTLGSNTGPTTAKFVFAWTDAQGNSISNNPVLTVDLPGIYTLTITNTVTGETASDTVIVDVDQQLPTVMINASDELTCETDIISLFGVSSTPNSSFQWTTTDGNILSDRFQPTISINEVGTYTLTVVNNSNGCAISESIFVDGNFAGQETITVPTISTDQASINLDAISQLDLSLAPYVFEWFFQNQPLFESTPSIDVNQTGTYTCLATNNIGCVSTIIYTVNFNTTLIADAGPDQALTCDIATVMLGSSLSSQGPNISYIWIDEFGAVVGTELFINVSAPGQYQLTVSDATTGEEAVDVVLVQEDTQFPTITIPEPEVITCAKPVVLLTAMIDIGINDAFIEWVDPNGIVISDTQTIEVNAPGTYIVSVTNTINACINSEAVEVLQNMDSEETIIVPTINSMESVVLLDPSSIVGNCLNCTYEWTAQNSNFSSTNQSVQVVESDTYTCVVTNAENGCTTTIVYTVVFESSSLIADAGPDQTITCDMPEVTLGGPNTSVGDSICYEWVGPAGFTSNLISVQTFSPGSYFFTVIDKITGNTATDTVLVTTTGTPIDFLIDTPDPITCTMSETTITSTILDPGFEVLWTTQDGIILSDTTLPTITVGSAGIYTLTITDPSNGCISTGIVEVTEDIDLPLVEVDVTNVSCFGENDGSATIIVSGGTPPYTFSGIDNPNQENLPPGIYIIDIVDAAGCSVTTEFVITEPSAIDPSIFINDDQNLEAMGIGGVPPYMYDWNVGVDSSVVVDPIDGTLYELTITDAIGCTQTTEFLFETNAVFAAAAKTISVYPNPTDGEIIMQLYAQHIQKVDQLIIYNIQGVAMEFKQQVIPNEGISLDLHHLQAGAYVLHAVIDGELYYQKVIVF